MGDAPQCATLIDYMNSIHKILLVGIYDTNTISLAPAILKAYVEQFDISLDFEIATKEFSIFSDSVESIVSSIKKESPDVVGFSVYIWNINEVLEIIKHLKGVIIVIGGPQVIGLEEKLIADNPDIDIIVSGEGEETFKELLEYFAGRRKINTIRGISTSDIKTNSRDVLPDLNVIPLLYKNILKQHPDISWISFETSRGCPMGCKYCMWGNKKIRYYALERVKIELDSILSQKNIQNIYLCDSNLLFNKKRAKEILRHIIKTQTNKSMRFEFSAEQLDEEIIVLMSGMPNNEFNFGLQSVNEIPLRLMGRSFNKIKFEEKYKKVIEICKRPNVTIDLIYGLPGDGIEGFDNSLDYAISLKGVRRILTNPLILLPGSQFFIHRDKYGITLRDDKSYIVKKTETFSQDQMSLARQHSLYVSVVFLNSLLVDCIKSFAQYQNKRYIDIIIQFIEFLPDDIIGQDFPDMIPSVVEGFIRRNRALGRIINRYDDIIDYFNVFSNHRYSIELKDYRNCFSEQHYKLRSFVFPQKIKN